MIMETTFPAGYRRIHDLPSVAQKSVFDSLKDGMLLAEARSKVNYLTGPRPEKLGVVTGRLRSSITTAVIKSPMPGIFAVGTIGTNVEYAALHEFGGRTPARPIVARNKDYLVFFWKKRGRWVRIPKIENWPGGKYPSRSFLRSAIKDTVPHIAAMVQRAIVTSLENQSYD